MTVHPLLQSFPSSRCITPNAVQPARRLALALLLAVVAGCHSMPALRSPAGAPWPSESVANSPTTAADSNLLSATPDFDEPAAVVASEQTEAQAVAKFSEPSVTSGEAVRADQVTAPLSVSGRVAPEISAPVVSAPPAAPPSSSTTSPVTPKPISPTMFEPKESTATVVGSNPDKGATTVVAPAAPPQTTTASVTSAKPSVTPNTSKPTDAAAAITPAANPNDVDDAAGKSGPPPASQQKTQVAEKPEQATTDQALSTPLKTQPLPKFSERPPEAFAWRRTGKSAGGRPFEFARAGTAGYRTLFIGSAVGNDPAAIQLMDKLAKHLHEESLIIGGFETTVIRTLNPDGAANREAVNALGRYVNGRFPQKLNDAVAVPTPEVEFLLGTVRSFHPQRVVHVRTIEDQAGIIAANQRATETAQSIAAALKFSRLTYPEQARKGSLEFCLSSESNLEVITLAIPAAAAKDTDLWEVYGDTLLNLIQPESLRSREASRDRK